MKRHLRHLRVFGLIMVTTIVSATLPAGADNRSGGHWDRFTNAKAQVYMIDFTPAGWPVNSATVRWNQNPRGKPGVYYRSPSQGCPTNPGTCVDVNIDTNTGGVAGFFTNVVPANNGGHFQVTPRQYIRLNPDVIGTDPVVRLAYTCHEIGHALGMAHNSTHLPSCMASPFGPGGNGFPQYPHDANGAAAGIDGHDYEELSVRIYNH